MHHPTRTTGMLGASATTRTPSEPPSRPMTIHGRRIPHGEEVRSLILPKKGFATIDNSDVVGHTYQGFEGYFVADVRAAYRLTPRIDVAAGVENLTDKRYFLFHPFPGRTFTAEVHWHL